MKVISDIERIQILDERFYTVDHITYYPSVTHILGEYPKGKWFNDWLKSVGLNADEIVNRAAEDGSIVHGLIDDYLNAKGVIWNPEKITLEQWKMFLKFVEFWQTERPELIACEDMLISDTLKVGGTRDLVCRIDGEVWLIDHKTSNSIRKTHEMQQAVYAKMSEDAGQKIDRIGILWLKAKTRTVKRFQGKGWQLVEVKRDRNDLLKLFKATKMIWDEENPNYHPKNYTLPTSVNIKEEVEL